MLLLKATFLLIGITLVRAEVCCPDVGCFSTDNEFSHLPEPKCPHLMQIKFGLYTRLNKLEPVYLSRSITTAVSASKRLMFIVHGYQNSYETAFMHAIKDEALEKEDLTVVLVGWSEGAGEVWYPQSASNTRTVGAEIALVMSRLKEEYGVSEDNLWCVGFSLGAHTCGQAGKHTTIGRITGLDPAGPWFHSQSVSARLDPTDAKFVDAIHTDGSGLALYYGMLVPSGHVDFYPNGGASQPGCFTQMPTNLTAMALSGSTHYSQWAPYMDMSVSCSHSRAPKYFIDSMKYPDCFVARQRCYDHKKIPKSCSTYYGEFATMGFFADKSGKRVGLFHLETRRKSPYCLY